MRQEPAFLTRAKVFGLTAVICLWGVQTMAADGLTTIRSSYGPKDTMSKLEAGVKARGMTVFARIDHAAGAAEGGLAPRPTDLLVLRQAQRRTPRLPPPPTIGINMPLKVRGCPGDAG